LWDIINPIQFTYLLTIPGVARIHLLTYAVHIPVAKYRVNYVPQ